MSNGQNFKGGVFQVNMATKVIAQPGESVDALIRKFNKKVQTEGIMAEIKKREHYLKPSLRKQQKIQMARKKYIRGKA